MTCDLKRPPQAERAEGLRRTLILCISQKLERMDISDLKELHLVATQIVQRKKNSTKMILRAKRMRKMHPNYP